jgi:hypothetical protein
MYGFATLKILYVEKNVHNLCQIKHVITSDSKPGATFCRPYSAVMSDCLCPVGSLVFLIAQSPGLRDSTFALSPQFANGTQDENITANTNKTAKYNTQYTLFLGHKKTQVSVFKKLRVRRTRVGISIVITTMQV